jgi:hypothetical protein
MFMGIDALGKQGSLRFAWFAQDDNSYDWGSCFPRSSAAADETWAPLFLRIETMESRSRSFPLLKSASLRMTLQKQEQAQIPFDCAQGRLSTSLRMAMSLGVVRLIRAWW